MKRSFYSDTISNFCLTASENIIGILARNNDFSLEQTQRFAWDLQIKILKEILNDYEGRIFFEYSIPRMGRRIDVVVIITNVIFVIEFKVGEKEFLLSSLDQVLDYALDLKNFHETSQQHLIAPILVATEAKDINPIIFATPHNDNILFPIKANRYWLRDVIIDVLQFAEGEQINHEVWEAGRYSPTPTIIEAAMALYNGHNVAEITKAVQRQQTSLRQLLLYEKLFFNQKKRKKKQFVLLLEYQVQVKPLSALILLQNI